MKYLQQFLIILGFTFLGQLLTALIPLPIPPAIYGIVLLFLALCLGIVKTEHIADTANFLISFMPFFLVTPTVNLLRYWGIILPELPGICVILLVSTLVTFCAAGLVTHLLGKRGGENG